MRHDHRPLATEHPALGGTMREQTHLSGLLPTPAGRSCSHSSPQPDASLQPRLRAPVPPRVSLCEPGSRRVAVRVPLWVLWLKLLHTFLFLLPSHALRWPLPTGLRPQPSLGDDTVPRRLTHLSQEVWACSQAARVGAEGVSSAGVPASRLRHHPGMGLPPSPSRSAPSLVALCALGSFYSLCLSVLVGRPRKATQRLSLPPLLLGDSRAWH